MEILLLTCTERPDREYSDVDRACILARSLERFLEPAKEWTVRVVAADREMSEIQDRLSRYQLKLRFHPHSEFIDEFPAQAGWKMQQLLKLLASRKIEGPFYLSIDSDHILTRRLTVNDVIHNGQSIVTPEPVDHHALWWSGSAKILGVEPVIGMGIAISCVPMATSVVRRLLDHLVEQLGSRWAELLISRWDWVDYALYYTFAQSSGEGSLPHKFGPLLGGDHSIWHAEDVERWNAEEAFSGDHHFICIQSNTDLPPDFVRELTAPYLGPWPNREASA